MSDDCVSLAPGQLRFYDNSVPALEVGDYVLNVSQRLNPASTTIDECYSASQAFSVQGPRYTLPTADFFSVFPPVEARGVFDQFLPSVTLTQCQLPWERNVFADTDPATQTPWLALLLFVDGEQIGGGDALLPPLVDGWKPNRLMSATIPAASFYAPHGGDGVLWPALTAEWYESADFLAGTPVSVIDVSAAAFPVLVPAPADLRYLAHVRQVDPASKSSDVLRLNGDGWYSVIAASRLPDAPPDPDTPGRRNIVHLVSLEGLSDYVAGGALPSGTTRVRMISLRSWTFTCLPEPGESFTGLMQGLLRGADGAPKGMDFTLPTDSRAVRTPDVQYARGAVAAGYVPMRYQTRLGERSFGWYRGPFAPRPVADFVQARPAPFRTASAAMVYDQEYGVFDVSYAAAWETGRLLALADGWFGPALLDWQRKGHRITDLILERKSQLAALPALRRAPGAAALLGVGDEPLGPLLERHALADRFIGGLPQRFRAKLGAGPRPRAFADTRSPRPTRHALGSLLAAPAVRARVVEAGEDEGAKLAAWLGEKYLLSGVPFENLVPHAALLPPESVRFFYVDPNWLDALLQGALSIGVETSRDAQYQALMMPSLRGLAAQAAGRVRHRLLGARAALLGDPLPAVPTAGMLLRSAAVSGWPGLEVHGYTGWVMDGDEVRPDPATAMQPLRLERLSADVMLCLWPHTPAVVTLDEPHEGITFGFEDPPQGKGDFLYLRSLDTASGYGMPLCTDEQIERGACTYAVDAVASGIIDPATRRVRITAAGGLIDTIRAKVPGATTVAVRDFAVQMIRVPEQAVFASPPRAPNGR